MVKHNKLTVLQEFRMPVGKSIYPRTWAWCKCDCGHHKAILLQKVISGDTVSCGCHARELSSKLRKDKSEVKDPHSYPEYSVWSGMKSRCNNSNDVSYQNYGARGITICDRWRHSFANFLADMGKRPSALHQIDRIDCNGDYEPGNCRWVTPKEQQRNKTNNHLLSAFGHTHCVSEWAEIYGIPVGTLFRRIEKGGSIERALLM